MTFAKVELTEAHNAKKLNSVEVFLFSIIGKCNNDCGLFSPVSNRPRKPPSILPVCILCELNSERKMDNMMKEWRKKKKKKTKH